MPRNWGRPLLAGLAAALVVAAIAALLLTRLYPTIPTSRGGAPSAAVDACLSPPDHWDPLHASPTQIASYGLPPRPDGDPTQVAKWLDIVSHAKHRVCGPGQVGDAVPATPSAQQLAATAFIQFSPGTTYSTALRTVTDLGLRLAGLPCPGGIQVVAGKSNPWWRWSPLVYADGFAADPALTVSATPLAPTDWLHAALVAPGVRDVRTDIVYHCPMIGFGPPPSDTLLALGPAQPASYLRLTFSDSVSYDAALLAVSNLGLRLADLCREHGVTSTWRPAGQENAYAVTHALLLATSPFASTAWQIQARALAGVSSLDLSPICPTT